MNILQEISDKVSIDVRSQYEQNPYPRWIYARLEKSPVSIEEFVKIRKLRVASNEVTRSSVPQILIAGCGTGQHPIQVAALFQNCKVLAVDLSLKSLAYAKRKTSQAEIENIDYMQADILHLGNLNRRFDIIQSGGVLHHMEYPNSGWKILTSLLKPGGIMLVGLYSELARAHIVRIRQEIKDLGIGTDTDSLREFRVKMIETDKDHHTPLYRNMDFYSLSEMRDLLFHVQEHRFTLSKIQKSLEDLGLKFCGFEGDRLLQKFQAANKKPEAIYDLGEWAKFESRNPNTFLNMYQFWCQRIS